MSEATATIRIAASDVVKPPGQREYREYTIVHEAGGVAVESKHRYNDFLVLHERIPALAGMRFPAPKSIFGLSTESAINERVATLQSYLRFVADKLPPSERAPLNEFLNLTAPATPAEAKPALAAPPGTLASASVLAANLAAKTAAAKAAAPVVATAVPAAPPPPGAPAAPAALAVPAALAAPALPPAAAAAAPAHAPLGAVVAKPVVAPPAKFKPTVNFNIDPHSADGRVYLEIKSAACGKQRKCPGERPLKQTMFHTPALVMLLAVVPIAIIGSLVALGVANNRSPAAVNGGHGTSGPGGALGAGENVGVGVGAGAVVGAGTGAPPCSASEGMLTLSSFPRGSLLAYVDGHWSSLCAGSVTSGKAANVACKQLGFEEAAGVFAAHKSRAPALPVEYVQCGGKEATLLDCKQHAFNAKSKAVCDADASQGLECVGGDGAPQARSCSAAPQLLRAQPAHAHPEASGVRAPTLASVGVFALVALVALAAGGARPWRAERTGLPVHVGAGQPATFQMI